MNKLKYFNIPVENKEEEYKDEDDDNDIGIERLALILHAENKTNSLRK